MTQVWPKSISVILQEQSAKRHPLLLVRRVAWSPGTNRGFYLPERGTNMEESRAERHRQYQ